MLKKIADWILRYEFYLMAVILVIFWYPDQRRVFALLLFIPLLGARLILYRRLWKPTPLDPLFVGFLLLCALNAFVAPYSFIAPDFGGLVMLGRPAMGMLLALSLVDRAHRQGRMEGVLLSTILLALLIAVLALLSSQWSIKSTALMFIINLLPSVRDIPQIGFNVNEIAGAMAYLTPLMAGLAVYYWTAPALQPRERLHRTLASSAFVLLWGTTFLGQSRMAILGLLPVLLAISLVLVPRGRWRMVALGFVAFFAVVQLLIFSGVFSPNAEQLAGRDEDSLTTRVLIWESGLRILLDYPLTGSGMNTFRTAAVRARYPVPGYEGKILPHAHNEWVQVGADLGIPGLIVVAGWYVMLARMLWKNWRAGDARVKALVFAAAGGMIAHLFYGLGDAIALWDRFAFVFWWMAGITLAQYILVHPAAKSVESPLIPVKS
jgi:O-antigen ligase